MKKIILCLLVTASAFTGFAQDISLGTKTLYTPLQKSFTAVPAGYTPVYINYVGRHGARHLTKDVNVSSAYQLVKKADSLNQLSAKGKDLKIKLANLQKEENGHVASISKSGEAELKGIATRMYNAQKIVFAGEKPSVLVATTKKGRTKESAEAFIDGMKAVKADFADVKYNYADDDHLRFYDFSGTYDKFKEEGNWTSAYEILAKDYDLKKMAGEFTSIFFNPSLVSGLTVQQKVDFLEDIYGFYTILDAVKAEQKAVGLTAADLDFKQYFNQSQLKALSVLGDAEDFLKKGPGLDNNGIQVRIAAPLLADFISTTDEYIANKKLAANLRFSHAETIAPFAALMDIKGASEAVKDIRSFQQSWKADKVIPFSANIQWILYKNKSGNYLVKFLLNEKEVAVKGLSNKMFPYYSWKSVRELYLRKLKSLGLNLDSDMNEYLIKVK
ncbi:histidine-type phosphatase [Pedobacter aquatilis]|uniref:histidine-type phosphatase n=1 Tax=Pedobacter aquatilis TaxID=351343 RepID=UPI00293187CE|nr:histidine-type phosphatase [Pedobacter aquatilis]